MKNLLFYVVQLLIIATLSMPASYGQSADGFALNPKFGSYFSGKETGGLGGVEVNVRFKGLIYGAQLYRHEESPFWLKEDPIQEFNQMGINVGSYVGAGLFRLQYQGGVSAFWGLRRKEFLGHVLRPGTPFYVHKYNSERFRTLGLTGKLGFKIIPLKYLSIGIDLEANLNSKKSFWMPMLSIELGLLRDKLKKK